MAVKNFLVPIIFFGIIAIVVGVFYYTRPDEYKNTTANVAPITNWINNTNEKRGPYTVSVFAENLEVPWAIVFTDENRMLVTERNGNIREIKDGELNPNPLVTLPETARGGEIGLMGLEKDPDYNRNKNLYACLGYREGSTYFDKILKLKDNETSISTESTILDKIPSGSNHAGCRLKFGPDGKLYATTGDATERDIAQDMNSLGGKILRMNNDGSVPNDNPFAGSLVYSLGHRNGQGIAWHKSGLMFETEHGPSGFDGPGGGDEINVIYEGRNYGWPLVSHEKTREGTEAPLLVFTPAVAPAAIAYWNGSLFFAALRGEGIYKIMLDPENPAEIISHEKLPEVDFGRIRELIVGPDDKLYFTTSNRDGRGKPAEGDDKIYVIE